MGEAPDPPIQALLDSLSRRISCDPARLASDLRLIARCGKSTMTDADHASLVCLESAPDVPATAEQVSRFVDDNSPFGRSSSKPLRIERIQRRRLDIPPHIVCPSMRCHCS